MFVLLKFFIKDYKNVSNECVRKKYGMFCGVLGICTNLILFFIKFLIGLFSNSVSIMADSFNNLSDSTSSIITLIGFKMSSKPADKEHPFGHGRIEYVSGLIVSFIIINFGIEFFKTSINKLINPVEVYFNKIVFFMLLFTILIKIWLYIFYKKIGKQINSNVILGTAIDSRNDIFITLLTIISGIIFKFLNINLDSLFGMIISIFLIYSGVDLTKKTISPLIGESIDKNLEQKIKDIVLEYDEILGVHALLIHDYGPNKRIASLHAEVSHENCINNIHNIIDIIEKQIFKELGIFLTIHVDPINTKDNRIKEIIEKTQKITKNKDFFIEAHDFRIVECKDHFNIIFDLFLPNNLSIEKQEELIKEIEQVIIKINPKYNLIINIENIYTNK